jgi:ELP3 family radical SAM enzyme/protein acetyltransferase
MFSNKYAHKYSIENIKEIFTKDFFSSRISPEEEEMIKKVIEASYNKIKNQADYQKFIMKRLNYKFNKTQIIKGYRALVKSSSYHDSEFENMMVLKSARGHSGVNVVTIFTSPVQFGDGTENSIKTGGCPMNCHYCPFEKDTDGIPTQPRSYLSTEPGNKRATQNLHHPIGQMFDRIFTLEEIGHIPISDISSSKLEIIISGGTFNFYPKDYIKWFVACMYFAANTYYHYRIYNEFPRDVLSLEEEQTINEKASLRVIGLTIETRPDYLDPRDYDIKLKNISDNDIRCFDNIIYFRELGITRIQIGIQHTNDSILKYVNRNCTNEMNKKAIMFLKQNGFKVDIHIMLDLPESSPEEDKRMLTEILEEPDYEADQWKIYPTEITNFTKIKEWYDEGIYQPYAEIDNGKLLEDTIIHAKKLMKPWIRINRVIRDIPVISIEGGISCPEMRQRIERSMKEQGIYCKCIRCREIKLQKISSDKVILKIRKYLASGGDEYFISYESKDEKILLGYIRLRLNLTFNMTIPALNNCALIRELHVLGKHTEIGTKRVGIQHMGYGKLLLQKAEEIAFNNNYNKIAIISGIGVRDYYKKCGYTLENTYMIKNKPNTFLSQINSSIKDIVIFFILFIIFHYIVKSITVDD